MRGLQAKALRKQVNGAAVRTAMALEPMFKALFGNLDNLRQRVEALEALLEVNRPKDLTDKGMIEGTE